MQRLVLIVLFWVLVPELLSGQTSARLRWEMGVFSASGAIKTPFGAGDTTEVLQKAALERVLMDFGYPEAQIDSIKGVEGSGYTVFGTAGPLYNSMELRLAIQQGRDPVDSVFLAKTGGTLTGLLQEGNENAIAQASKKALFVQESIVEAIQFDKQSRRIFLNAVATAVRLERAVIEVSDGEKLPISFLEKLSGIENAALLTPKQVSDVRKVLQSSGYFSEVGEGEIHLTERNMKAVFATKNLPLHTFDAVLAWISKPEGGGILAGNAELRARNLLREGSAFYLKYERQRPEVSRLQMQYRSEFLWNSPIGLKTGVQFFQQDSLYLLRSLELEPFYRLGPFSTVGLTYRRELSSGGVLGSAIAASNATIAGVAIEHRQTDDVFIPRRGLRLQLRAEQGRKTTAATSERTESRNTVLEAHLSLQAYFPVFNDFVLVPTLQTGGVRTDWYSETDLERIGGASSLRGFQEGQFEGVLHAWGDLEARYLPDRNTFLFVFGAAGTYQRLIRVSNNTQRLEWSDRLVSAGFGLADKTRLGLLKVSYAFSNQTGSVGGGQVHVSLKNDL